MRLPNKILRTLLLLALLPGSGCDADPPRVDQVRWIPHLVQTEQGPERQLSLYVQAQEGAAALTAVKLMRGNLFWLIEEDDWQIREESGLTWIGSDHLASAALPFVEGEYTLQVIDRGGRIAEQALYLEGWPDDETFAAQEFFNFENGRREIRSEYDEWYILIPGKPPQPCPANTPFDPRTAFGAEGEFSLMLFHEAEMWGIRLGPFYF